MEWRRTARLRSHSFVVQWRVTVATMACVAGCGTSSPPGETGGSPGQGGSSVAQGGAGQGGIRSDASGSIGQGGATGRGGITPEASGTEGQGGTPALDAARSTDAAAALDASGGGAPARVVAYVNCTCGFGAGAMGGACLADPDPTVNQVKDWEDTGRSPITHYVISFLSFRGVDIQGDPGSIWKNGGGSTTDLELAPGLRDAMQSARAHGKRVMLSLGGEAGSTGFLAWWMAQGAATDARVAGMRSRIAAAVSTFQTQNAVGVDGIDVDIELGGAYAFDSDKYRATRDLINAIPDELIAAFVPQVGNGLCAAPVVGDPLPPTTTLGGQCMNPVNGDDTPWTLARLDQDCLRADGRPKLDYFGIQYYNAAQAECCGGGSDAAGMIRSTVQNYVNLANGWPAAGDVASTSNPWHAYQFFPGPWAAFDGIGADRLVLGKPGCQGCAGSDYLDPASVSQMIAELDGRLLRSMGGLLFWDLCRLFGGTGPECVGGQCQPSWGGAGALATLTAFGTQMQSLRRRTAQ